MMNIAFKNSIVALVAQSVTLILSFILQSVFARTLGGTYLGLNGMFSNVLTILSFTELGFGNAIAFALYKPLQEKDDNKIDAIMTLFKKVYFCVGMFILLASLLFAPFVGHFVSGANVPNIKLYFLLFALNSAASYFLSYKRTLLIADQKGYLNIINQLSFKVFVILIQVYFLISGSYFGFLITQILGTLISNIVISKRINKMYTHLFPLKKLQLDPVDLKQIKESTMGGMGQKIGSIVVNNTNNLLIASFVSLMVTGIYSSYMMIVTGISVVISQFVNAITASVGNMAVVTHSKKMVTIFERHQFLTVSLGTIIATIMISLMSPFVSLWLGEKFILSNVSVYLISINFLINMIRLSYLSFIQALGLFKMIGVKSVIEAAINIVGCLVALKVYHLGINGILLVTLAINLLFNVSTEAYIVYNYGFKTKMEKLFIPKIFSIVMYVIFSGNVIMFVNQKLFSNAGVLTFIVQTIVSIILALILYLPIFLLSKCSDYYQNIVMSKAPAFLRRRGNE